MLSGVGICLPLANKDATHHYETYDPCFVERLSLYIYKSEHNESTNKQSDSHLNLKQNQYVNKISILSINKCI